MRMGLVGFRRFGGRRMLSICYHLPRATLGQDCANLFWRRLHLATGVYMAGGCPWIFASLYRPHTASLYCMQVLVGFLLPKHARANIVAVMLCNTITSQVSVREIKGRVRPTIKFSFASHEAVSALATKRVYAPAWIGVFIIWSVPCMQTLTILGDYKTALFLRVKPWKMFAAQVVTQLDTALF